MQDACLKIENLFLKAGQSNYYQYIITLLFTLEFLFTHLLNNFIPYFERVPEIRMRDSQETQEFSFGLCKNLTDFSIFENSKMQTSIAYEFNIICNKTKIYFLGLCYHIGKFFGSCLSYLFIDRIGRRIPLLIFIPISILLMAAFKFMKASYSTNWIYGIYVNLFLSGVCNYIIIVDILIYISEIVQQTKIPYYIMVIATGSSIAGLLSSIIFYVDKTLDWRDILLIFAGIHLLVYIIIIFTLIDSPMFALNMENFEDFSLYLSRIASRNGRELTQQDYIFLAPYMDKERRKNMFTGNQNNNLAESSSSSSSYYERQNENSTNNEMILDKETIETKALKMIKKEREKDVTYTSGGNKIYSGGQLIYSNPYLQRKSSIFVRDNVMRDVYLLSLGEDTDVPVKSLFGESKMKDFTPLDLLRFNSQIKHFLCLTFIWIVTVIIRSGIDFRKKYMFDYIGRIEYPVSNYCLEIFLPLLLLAIYHKYNYSIQKILVMSNLIQFLFLVFVGFFIQKDNSKTQVVFLMLTKVCSHAIYLVMYVITVAIYPIMIRTKGVGFNIGFSAIGTIVAIFLVENLKFDSLILYFLLFNFFSMVICYGLPMKIGTFLLDNPKYLRDQEDEDDVKLGDICIENAIMVNVKKPKKPKVEKKETTQSTNPLNK